MGTYKTLKLDHRLADAVRAGIKTTTWRMFDDKDLATGDVVTLIDKVDPTNQASWRTIGTALLRDVTEKPLYAVTTTEMSEHSYDSVEHMLQEFRRYYGEVVTMETTIKVLRLDYRPE